MIGNGAEKGRKSLVRPKLFCFISGTIHFLWVEKSDHEWEYVCNIYNTNLKGNYQNTQTFELDVKPGCKFIFRHRATVNVNKFLTLVASEV